jgi:hypothetical protein
MDPRPSEAIALVRRLALRVEGPDGERFRAALACYEREAPAGMTLEDALGLTAAPGTDPWWTIEARQRRDQAIRDFVRAMFGAVDDGVPKAAAKEIRDYQTDVWPRDRIRKVMPEHYRGTPREFLYIAFHEATRISAGRAGDVPTSVKSIRAILWA